MSTEETMNSQVTLVEPEAIEYWPAKTLLRLVEQSQAAARNFKTHRATVAAFPDLFRRIEELEIEPSFEGNNDYISLNFTGDGEKLKAVWGALRRAGYNTVLRPEKGQTTFYAFWEQAGYTRIFMAFCSSVCRRVKVGTKTVEQDIYEVQCGELPELEQPSRAAATTNFGSDIPF